MPRKITLEDSHTKKWNLYVNELDKLEFIKALVISGKTRAQSAAIRALMYLYISDIEVQNKVNTIVDDFIVYNQNGEKSIL